jgi:hypothetical protein
VDSNSGVKLDRDEWLDDGALADAKKALIEEHFREMETHLHASVPWEEAKLRRMSPFKR